MDSIISLLDKRKALQKEFDLASQKITQESAKELIRINKELQKLSAEIEERLKKEFG